MVTWPKLILQIHLLIFMREREKVRGREGVRERGTEICGSSITAVCVTNNIENTMAIFVDLDTISKRVLYQL